MKGTCTISTDGRRVDVAIEEKTPGACAQQPITRPSTIEFLHLTVYAMGSEGSSETKALAAVKAAEQNTMRSRVRQTADAIRCTDPNGCGSEQQQCRAVSVCGVVGERCTDLCQQFAYQPDPATPAGQRAAAARPVADPEATKARRTLRLAQSPALCRVPDVRRFQTVDQGLGFVMNIAAARLASEHASLNPGVFAFDAGPGVLRRTESTLSLWGPTCNTPLGKLGGLACHFYPATPCDIVVKAPDGHIEHLDALQGLRDATIRGAKARARAPWYNFVPEEWQHRGALWYHSQALTVLWRPWGEALRQVRRTRDRLGWKMVKGTGAWGSWEERTIALHLRRSELCHDQELDANHPSRCVSLAAYAQALNRMSEIYNVTRVFISTDATQIDVAQWCNNLGSLWDRNLNCRQLPWDRTKFRMPDSIATVRTQRWDVDGLQVGRNWLVDLEFMARCHYFVGTFGTGASSLALSLMVGRLGYVPPYESVDRRAWAQVDQGKQGTFMW